MRLPVLQALNWFSMPGLEVLGGIRESDLLQGDLLQGAAALRSCCGNIQSHTSSPLPLFKAIIALPTCPGRQRQREAQHLYTGALESSSNSCMKGKSGAGGQLGLSLKMKPSLTTSQRASCAADKAPFLVDLKKPESKIPHTVNFYIRVEPRVMLGIWHTVPSCRGEDAKGKNRCWYEAALHDGNPIIVYLHGSAEHSQEAPFLSTPPPTALHLRGFGDSTGKPTEEGLTADAICVYEWTKARCGATPVCLWGHSLGTGVATNAAKVLEEKGCPVDAIVLESPFTNIWVASINYPLLKLYEIAHDAYRHKERVKMVIFPPGFHHNFLYESPILLRTVR
ncbi:Abhydrolase domain-containing protein 12B [Sciurus carolinensis]|uniref:Abhydrolase domain-containing protein 12B n=1 Tax=Sciurus carolinensis TaxID=30640 RepID=A0AA41MS89_SCICA|nr:Abhydrolase domain-containing protein 12B [Sciurus carolinensis]